MGYHTNNGTQFESWEVRDLCQELHIKHHFFYPRLLTKEWISKVSNKTIITTLKKRLESSKAKWINELLVVLWAYRVTPHSAIKETPFLLAYGVEVIIPVEIGFIFLQIQEYNDKTSHEALSNAITFLKEKKEMTTIQAIAYQQRITRGYNRRVQHHPMNKDNLVFRVILDPNKHPDKGKLAPTWDDPFHVSIMSPIGTYLLIYLDGTLLPQPWN